MFDDAFPITSVVQRNSIRRFIACQKQFNTTLKHTSGAYKDHKKLTFRILHVFLFIFSLFYVSLLCQYIKLSPF